MVTTVPQNLPPGSDVANLAVFGYDPQKYYTGRSPLEAVSMGVPLELTDTAFRANLVTLSDAENYADKTMVDYSSDEISTEEAHQLIAALNDALKTDSYEFHGGISYRHLMVWHNRKNDFSLTPPHDISDRVIGEYLPADETILILMKKSYDILKDHPGQSGAGCPRPASREFPLDLGQRNKAGSGKLSVPLRHQRRGHLRGGSGQGDRTLRPAGRD